MVTSAVPWPWPASSASWWWSSASGQAPRLRSTQPAKFTARPAKRGTWRRSTSAVYLANAASACAGRPASACACPVNSSACMRGRGVLHPDLPAGRRAQQRQRLLHPALVRPEHPEPPGGGHPVRALGEGERLAEQQFGPGQVAGRVPGPAAGRQAPGPGGRVVRGQRAVLGELGGLRELAAEVRRPGADLQRGRAGRRRPAPRPPRPRRNARAGCGPGPGPASRPGRRPAAARRRAAPRPPRSRSAPRPAPTLAQRAGGQHQVTAQPRVPGHGQRVGAGPPVEHPAGLPVQQRGPSRGRARRQRLPDQLVPEPEDPVLLDQELLGHRLLGVVEQRDDRAAEHRGEQVGVQLRADHGRGAQQQPGRAELVAPRGHRLHQRRGQFRARGLLGQFGQEQRMPLRPGVQLLDPARPDQLGRRVPAQRAEVDERRRRAAARPRRSGPRRRPPPRGSPAGRSAASPASAGRPGGRRRPRPPAARAPPGGRAPGPGPSRAPPGRACCPPAWAAAAGPAPGSAAAPAAPRRRRGCRRRPGPELAQQAGQRGQQRVERHRAVERPARRDQHRVPGRRAPPGPGPQQRRLADAGLAVDHGHLGGAAAGPRRDRLQAGQLVVPADQPGTRAGPAGPARPVSSPRRIAV